MEYEDEILDRNPWDWKIIKRPDTNRNYYPGDLIKDGSRWGYVLGFRLYTDTMILRAPDGSLFRILPPRVQRGQIKNFSRQT